MNDRRMLLTKDEVKKFGIELTASTTDIIKTLYIPVNFMYSMSFNYCSSSGSTSTMTEYSDNNNYYALTSSDKVTFNSSKLITVPSRYGTYGNYNTTYTRTYYLYPTYRESGTVGGANIIASFLISDLDNDGNPLYYKIDTNNIRPKGISGKYFKVYSFSAPEDTIFYEPYE